MNFDDAHDKRRPRKKPELVADHIKRWIMNEGLAEGTHLPQEKELMALFGVSRATIREALTALELQGLVRIRPGPGGGATVDSVTDETTVTMLSNYFFSQDITLAGIYEVRKLLEPQMAEAAVGHLTDEQMELLRYSIGFCALEPNHREGSQALRMNELDFHDILADACPNRVLALFSKAINSLLKNLAVARKIYEAPPDDLGQGARVYHAKLYDALKAGDAKEVRELMLQHVVEAERIMIASEAVIENRFILAE